MNRKAIALPKLSRLKELFSYDPETGFLTRKVDVPKAKAGSIAGTKNGSGALILHIDYRVCYAHRVAWALFYGEEPPAIMDHINGDRSDNRIINLRAATSQQNNFNRRAWRCSKSGVKGAHWSSLEKKWRSSIKINGQYIHLGWFRSSEEAAAAYKQASIKYQGEFAVS